MGSDSNRFWPLLSAIFLTPLAQAASLALYLLLKESCTFRNSSLQARTVTCPAWCYIYMEVIESAELHKYTCMDVNAYLFKQRERKKERETGEKNTLKILLQMYLKNRYSCKPSAATFPVKNVSGKESPSNDIFLSAEALWWRAVFVLRTQKSVWPFLVFFYCQQNFSCTIIILDFFVGGSEAFHTTLPDNMCWLDVLTGTKYHLSTTSGVGTFVLSGVSLGRCVRLLAVDRTWLTDVTMSGRPRHPRRTSEPAAWDRRHEAARSAPEHRLHHCLRHFRSSLVSRHALLPAGRSPQLPAQPSHTGQSTVENLMMWLYTGKTVWKYYL